MRKPFPLITGIVLLIGAAITPIVATFITFVMPESFNSTARIVPAVSDPRAIATEVEKIHSQAVLLPVVTNLNLAQKYAERFNLQWELPVDSVCQILAQQCEIKQASSAQIIEVTVWSDNSIEAATIANEIALVYSRSPLAASGADARGRPQIIDPATPALRPARPNKVLSIASGIGVGAIMALLGIWLVLRRAGLSDGPEKNMTGGQPPNQPPPLPAP